MPSRRKRVPRASPSADAGQRWTHVAAYALVTGLAFVILRPFVVPMAWAAIIAYGSWPLFVRLERALGGRSGWAAGLMIVLVLVVIMIPTGLISLALANEVSGALGDVAPSLAHFAGLLVGALKKIPVLGPQLADQAATLLADPAGIDDWVRLHARELLGQLATVAGDVGRALARALVTLITLFFFYRHGRALTAQIGRVAVGLGGNRLVQIFRPMADTVRAVFYGTLLTALAQGLLVMIGCWAVGLRAPVLLGALSALLAVTPVGPALVYLPASIWLFVQERALAGGFLLAWGVLVVGTSDNVIRSWVLSGAVRMPFLLSVLGLLGGLAAFGPIGLFVGPVGVALFLALWRERHDTA
jgi:predicted PurR-regulated permease PerM